MRVAIVADIHGNIFALDGVLSSIEADNISQIVCLGDVAGLGSHPLEVVARLRGIHCPVVMGNADQFLIEPWLLDPMRHPDADDVLVRLHEMERWCAEQLQPDDLAFLRTFQPMVEIPLDRGATLRCYHGSPRSIDEHINGSTPDADLVEILGPAPALVMAGGHTHEQFVRRLWSSFIMNPGSVGLAYETLPAGGGYNPPWGEYAVLTYEDGRIQVDLRRIPVDQAAIRQALLASGMPHAEWWAADRR